MTDRDSQRGLLDTSIFVAAEAGRQHGRLPDAAAVSVVTVAELYLGVLMADDAERRGMRLRTLSMVEDAFDLLPIDVAVARRFAELVARERRAGRRPQIMDLWIAATAATHDLPLYTQDRDFLSIEGVEVRLI